MQPFLRAHSSTHSHRHSESGQIGLIVLLVMVVLLTIGISLAAQSTKEVSLSTQDSESTRTFNAAEAGVESALSTNLAALPSDTTTVTPTIPNSSASVSYTILKQKTLEVRVPQGSTAMVQLTDSSGTLTATSINIEWAKETVCGQTPASLVLAIYSKDTSKTPQTSVRYLTYAPRGCSYNDSVTAAVTPGTGGYYSLVNLSLANALLNAKDVMIRIKPAYNDTQVRVTAVTGTLPTQQYAITSSATNTGGGANRTVQVNRTLSIAPSIMDYAVFSGTTLVK